MEHMSNIFSTSIGINFAKLTRVWLTLISLTAKFNSLLYFQPQCTVQRYLQVGYDGQDGYTHFHLRSTQLVTSTNVDVTGRWVFHVNKLLGIDYLLSLIKLVKVLLSYITFSMLH